MILNPPRTIWCPHRAVDSYPTIIGGCFNISTDMTIRFNRDLAISPARLDARMESLSPYSVGSFIPYNMPIYPGALQFSRQPRLNSAAERAGAISYEPIAGSEQ